MFIRREDWEKISAQNQKLKEEYWELQKKETLFENAFFNGLDGLLEKYYRPEPEAEPAAPASVSTPPAGKSDVFDVSGCTIQYQEAPDSKSDKFDVSNCKISYQETSRAKVVPDEIDKVLAEIDESFSDRLMEIIRERKLNEVEVYKKADLDRRHFSKIRSNSQYRPTKDTVILLCMSMELSFDETADLLKRAGFAFSDSSKTDLIAQFFIRKKLYDIQFYKEVLYKYGVLG